MAGELLMMGEHDRVARRMLEGLDEGLAAVQPAMTVEERDRLLARVMRVQSTTPSALRQRAVEEAAFLGREPVDAADRAPWRNERARVVARLIEFAGGDELLLRRAAMASGYCADPLALGLLMDATRKFSA